MVRRNQGYLLAELGVAMLVAVVISISCIAALARQSVAARMLYEERVAWEIAAGRLAMAEAGQLELRAGPLEIPKAEPGWENLSGASCRLRLSSDEPASLRATV
ncbi:MAG TPA: hypothetical protein VMU54_21770, partial [Planctomycetota bacterium]|nr:hypothetical protein [Planctomycetota bacterium]